MSKASESSAHQPSIRELMEHTRYPYKIVLMLTARAEQFESVVAAAQAESLPPWVKLPVPEVLRGSMDSKRILKFICKYKLYFRLVSEGIYLF